MKLLIGIVLIIASISGIVYVDRDIKHRRREREQAWQNVQRCSKAIQHHLELQRLYLKAHRHEVAQLAPELARQWQMQEDQACK